MRAGRPAAVAAALVLLLLAAAPVGAQESPPAAPAAVPAPGPVVHAVLFYSPTCPHCRKVLQEDLPSLVERFGEGLRIVTVNTASEGGQALYQAAIRHFDLGRGRQGVPMLVVDETVLVGSLEIPVQLPGIVERGLAGGGIAWPRVPEIVEALVAEGLSPAPAAPPAGAEPTGPATDDPAAAPTPGEAGPAAGGPTEARGTPAVPGAPADPGPATVPAPATGGGSTTAPAPPADPAPATAVLPPARRPSTGEGGSATDPGADRTPSGDIGELTASAFDDAHDAAGAAVPVTDLSMAGRFRLDPVGGSAAVAVLLLLGAALAAGVAPATGWRGRLPAPPEWAIPVLATVGMGVAAYLAFVEVTGAEAVCGPVGDCNTVQQSEYARLFGVLPVGVLGVIGYGAFIAGWAAARFGPPAGREAIRLALWAMALAATLFSAWLTFLEPFVIGATCAWCLSSAVVTALILLATTGAVTRSATRSSSPA